MTNPARRLVLGLLLATIWAAVGVVAWSAPAQAEGLIVASEPRAREEVAQSPGAVTLAFGGDVDPSQAKIVVLNAQGTNVTAGELIVEGSNVTSYLQNSLPAGTYTVHYRISRPDGEGQGGAYQFSVGAGSWTTPEDESWSGDDQEPPVMKNPDPNASRPASDEPTPTASVPEVEGGSASPAPSSTEPTSSASASSPSPSAPDTATPTAPASPVESPTSEPTADPGGSVVPWIIGGIAVLAAALVAFAVAVRRRSRGRP